MFQITNKHLRFIAQLIGAGLYRGSIVVMLFLFATVADITEVGYLGYLLTSIASIVVIFSSGISLYYKNRILKNEIDSKEILISIFKFYSIIVFVLTVICFLIKSINVEIPIVINESVIILTIAQSVIFFSQHLAMGYGKFFLVSVINSISGILYFSVIIFYMPTTYIDFIFLYAVVATLHAVLITIVIIISALQTSITSSVIRSQPAKYKFLFNHTLYSLSGMPVFFLVQTILLINGEIATLGTITLLVQVTNIINFFNYQLILVWYNELVEGVKVSYEKFRSRLKKISLYYFIINISLLLIMLPIMIVFKDFFIQRINISIITLIIYFTIIAFTSIQWLLNESFIALDDIKTSLVLNTIWAILFIILIMIFFSLLQLQAVEYYILAIGISKFLILFFTIKIYRKKAGLS